MIVPFPFSLAYTLLTRPNQVERAVQSYFIGFQFGFYHVFVVPASPGRGWAVGGGGVYRGLFPYISYIGLCGAKAYGFLTGVLT